MVPDDVEYEVLLQLMEEPLLLRRRPDKLALGVFGEVVGVRGEEWR